MLALFSFLIMIYIRTLQIALICSHRRVSVHLSVWPKTSKISECESNNLMRIGESHDKVSHEYDEDEPGLAPVQKHLMVATQSCLCPGNRSLMVHVQHHFVFAC
ncbi:hypothetical protein Droror1_Dr00013689 [Drosera rotundifolia]